MYVYLFTSIDIVEMPYNRVTASKQRQKIIFKQLNEQNLREATN